MRARALLVAMALLAGCGGGGASETKPAEPALPPAEPEAPPADLDVGLPLDPPLDADGLPPASVKQADLEPLRVSGDLAGLEPPAQVLHRSLIARLCLDKTGAPSAVKLMRSTGDRAFDRTVLLRLTGWRFKPFLVETVPVGVCTVLIAKFAAP
jgi:hypothetical protein